MRMRFLNMSFFFALYVSFLSWYDGWWSDPLTISEVDSLTDKLVAQGGELDGLERLREFGNDDDGEEFFMLNLNRYDYAEGEAQQGVPANYQEYGQAVIFMILKNAGHPIFSGNFFRDFVSPEELENSDWHEIIMVRYRSRRDFLNMITSDEYLKIAKHRSGAIEYEEVVPARASINLVTPRFFVFTLFLALAWLIDNVIRRNSRL